jgi:hypothetical protein
VCSDIRKVALGSGRIVFVCTEWIWSHWHVVTALSCE